MSRSSTSGDWVRVTPAAVLLDVDGSTVRRWCRTGYLVGARLVGGCWRIPMAAIRAVLNPPAELEVTR